MSTAFEDFTAAQRLALAAVFDVLAFGLSYPGETHWKALRDGSWCTQLREAAGELPDLQTAVVDVCNGVDALLDKATSTTLESDYIRLFEADIDGRALHMYGHLYDKGGRSTVDMLRQLQQLYRSGGVELKGEGQAERADHLGVQFEFASFMLRTAGNHDEQLLALRGELDWVSRFCAQFQQAHRHVLYSPLIHLSGSLVQLFGVDEGVA